MPSHVAFLRGINVGGRTVTNDRLAELFTDMGFEQVVTFLASGNVLFTPDGGDDVEALADRVAAHLRDALGWAVPTFVRTADQVTAVADADPFPDAPAGGKVHVAFLRAPIATEDQHAIRACALDTDAVVFDDTEMYWHVGTGRMMESGIGDPAIAKLLDDRWTLRTANTVQRIARKL